jgi:hypothetical protein
MTTIAAILARPEFLGAIYIVLGVTLIFRQHV